jgi:hypothetical protein
VTPRATRPALAATVGLLAWVLVAPAAQAAPPAPEPAPPLGQATAEVGTLAVAGFSLVVPFGVAEADIDGTGARAASVFIDWTVPATLFGAVSLPTLEGAGIPTELPPFPSAVRVDSAGEHHAARPAPLPLVGPTGTGQEAFALGGGYEQAHIEDGPSSWARTDVGTLSSGVASARGGSSLASAAPHAVASESVLGELRLGVPGSEVVLRDLHWAAGQTLGERATASFGLGAIEIGGARHVAPAPGELAAIFEVANTALAPTGISITAPVVEASDTGSLVSSLVIRYGASAVAAGTADPAYAAIAPVLLPLVDSAQQLFPEVGTAFYLFTVLQAVITGHGDLTLELGGASAHIAALAPAEVSGGPAPAPVPVVADPATGPSGLGAPSAPPAAGAEQAAVVPAVEAAPQAPALAPGLPSVTRRERVAATLVAATTLVGLLGAAMVARAERARRRQAGFVT